MKPFRAASPAPPPERIPWAWTHRVRSAPEAEVRQAWWNLLKEHYQEHQSGPLLVLIRGGYSEMILTQDCPDCQRYSRGFDAHQRGDGIGKIIMEIFGEPQ